jgi:hypothetical protein
LLLLISASSSSSSSSVMDGPSGLARWDASRSLMDVSGIVDRDGKSTEKRCESLAPA